MKTQRIIGEIITASDEPSAWGLRQANEADDGKQEGFTLQIRACDYGFSAEDEGMQLDGNKINRGKMVGFRFGLDGGGRSACDSSGGRSPRIASSSWV